MQEYPDYYEIIRRPIDMQKVLQRMMASQYQSLDDMVTDFVLMFDNACKYNEPESLIYKVPASYASLLLTSYTCMHAHTHTHTTVLQLSGFCLGQPG